MKQTLVGRADLVRALVGGENVEALAAEQLGFVRVSSMTIPAGIPSGTEDALPAESVEPVPDNTAPYAPVPFWRVDRFELTVVEDRLEAMAEEEKRASAQEESHVESVSFDPLASFAEVFTRLRHQSALNQPGKRLDVDRIVTDLSRCREIHRFPRLHRRTWGAHIHVVIDLARRLFPYRKDQEMIAARLRMMLPRFDASISVLRDGDEQPMVQWPESELGRPLAAERGATILVLTDLGVRHKDVSAQQRWLRMGRRWRELECRTLALVPCRPDSLSPQLTAIWSAIRWERESVLPPVPTDAITNVTLKRLLALMSRAVRVEPELLRALRRMFPEGARDPGLEALVWQEADGTNHCSAAALKENTARRYRNDLQGEPLDLAAFQRVASAHADGYAGVSYMEVLNLGTGNAALASKQKRLQARKWFERIVDVKDDDARVAFFVRAAGQFSREAYRTHPVLNVLYSRHVRTGAAPNGFDPAQADSNEPERVCRLVQVGDTFVATVDGSGKAANGSLLCRARFRDGRIRIEEFPDGDSALSEAERGLSLPVWADDGGRDSYGVWAEILVGRVRQRLRWIPPGRFLMGSPPDEAGRFEGEGPRHNVTVSTGFWLFDTPCTQELWEAVMGSHPSYFKGDRRPVESVSWVNCQQFIKKLNLLIPGLDVGLPSEAQWEYACRAGTVTAYYHEDLDRIAWYNKNSDDKTHDVAGKLANAWGLYDMLGNVWEWCQDHTYREYSKDTVVDPVHEKNESSAYRVFRGGSYLIDALHVRAAYRGGIHPGDRSLALGFRCCSLGSELVTWQGEGGAGTERRSRGGAGGDSAVKSDERWFSLNEDDVSETPTPEAAVVRITTDREILTLQQTVRPSWARVMGRDRYGLWSEFEIEREEKDPVIQKMRWIPPGRFMMGSPETEDGRWDAEGPLHEEMLRDGFWLFDTPCTQALWEAVMGTNPSRFKGPSRPMEQVSWNDCQVFLKNLNARLDGLSLGLPGEVQWEYACRAGTQTARYHSSLDRVAWYANNSNSETHDVAQLEPNDWGLYDMLGNVWEWCSDPWRHSYKESILEEPGSSADRGFRGGSCLNDAQDVRAAHRDGHHPGTRALDLGFRCCSLGSELIVGQGGRGAEAERRSRSGAGGDSAAKSDERWFHKALKWIKDKK